MNRCSCGREKCTYPECDDGPLPGPVWNRVHTAAALAQLAGEIAKLQDRVKKLEQTVSSNTWLDARVETLEQTITKWESDS